MKIPNLEKFDPVEIEMYDLTSQHGWQEIEDAELARPVRPRFVAYYLNHNSELMRFAHMLSVGKNEANHIEIVPISSIYMIKPITVGDKLDIQRDSGPRVLEATIDLANVIAFLKENTPPSLHNSQDFRAGDTLVKLRMWLKHIRKDEDDSKQWGKAF